MKDLDLALHALSPWLPEADAAVLAQTGDEWLPAKHVASKKFRICCIPFRVYDLHDGDVVECDDQKRIIRVVEKSGKIGFRITNTMSEEDTKRLVDGLRVQGCAIEFATDSSLIGISAPELVSQDVADLLLALETDGRLKYETILSGETDAPSFGTDR